MTADWPELAQLVSEIIELDAEGWRRSSEVRSQANSLSLHVAAVEQCFTELDIGSHLRILNERLLAGVGSVELVEGGMGIERIASLVWPSEIHPQPTPGSEQAAGMYRIEVWLGPGPQDGKPRIRIAGTKRLEAVLPTSSERFRTALLAVFQNPAFLPRPEDQPEAEVSENEDEGS